MPKRFQVFFGKNDDQRRIRQHDTSKRLSPGPFFKARQGGTYARRTNMSHMPEGTKVKVPEGPPLHMLHYTLSIEPF